MVLSSKNTPRTILGLVFMTNVGDDHIESS